MIEAYFDSRSGRSGLIAGVYQYDTGQRLRLHGLPGADELGSSDDPLSDAPPAVQVQYGYAGDSQTQARLAEWNEERAAWLAEIPDEYLTRSEAVHVFVYLTYGADENGSRAKTMYEGVFTPIARPAPDDKVTEDQLARWQALSGEIDLFLSGAQNAIDLADGMAESTGETAEQLKAAEDAAQRAARTALSAEAALEQQADRWQAMQVRTVSAPADEEAAATISGSVLTFFIPRGTDGARGAQGEDGPTDIALSFSDGVLTITPR